MNLSSARCVPQTSMEALRCITLSRSRVVTPFPRRTFTFLGLRLLKSLPISPTRSSRLSNGTTSKGSTCGLASCALYLCASDTVPSQPSVRSSPNLIWTLHPTPLFDPHHPLGVHQRDVPERRYRRASCITLLRWLYQRILQNRLHLEPDRKALPGCST